MKGTWRFLLTLHDKMYSVSLFSYAQPHSKYSSPLMWCLINWCGVATSKSVPGLLNIHFNNAHLIRRSHSEFTVIHHILWFYVFLVRICFMLVFYTNFRRKNSTTAAMNSDTPSPPSQLLTRADLEAFKREILTEIRKETKTLKSDILDGMRNLKRFLQLH